MRLIPPTIVFIAVPTLLASQETPLTPVPPGPRKVTAVAGIGNAMGWFGIQGEGYFARERFSVFAGLGYTLADVEGDPSGATFAVGARGFTAGLKHRGFLELSISQIAVRAAVFDDGDRYYGPGLQAGYQFVSRGGFSLMASLGLGYGLGIPDGETKVHGLGALGLGYTWRGKTAEAFVR
jgi:hypothetical protein